MISGWRDYFDQANFDRLRRDHEVKPLAQNGLPFLIAGLEAYHCCRPEIFLIRS
jgi:hypothetical protein